MKPEADSASNKQARPASLWVIYVGILLAGILLVGDAYALAGLSRWTAKLGIALLWAAAALVLGRGRWMGYASAAIVVVAVTATFIF